MNPEIRKPSPCSSLRSFCERSFAIAACAWLGAVAPAGALTITAGFSGGGGTASVDQYQGKAGAGWAGAWSTAGTVTGAIATSAPLNSGGNYLQLTVGSTTVDAAVGRSFVTTDESSGVAANTVVIEKFDIRLDSALTNFTDVADYITIAGNASSVNSSGTTAFLIRAFGASPAAGKNAREWLFYDGGKDGGAYAASNWVNSGMTLADGTVYTFTVELDPGALTYSVTVTDGASTKTVSGLGFRAATGAVPNTLAFNGRKNATGDSLQLSIDNISIYPKTPYTPSGAALPFIMDMALDNPDEGPTISNFNDPAFLAAAGFQGKVFGLFDSATLAVNWDSIDPNILPAGSADRAWVEAKAADLTARYHALKLAGQQVYCMSDLMIFPKKLVSLKGISSTFGNINNASTEYWLRAQIRLAFEQFPDLDGIVVRIGETYLHDAPYHQGKIDNPTNAASTIIPLMNVLRDEACVKLGKKIFFRSWYSFDVNTTTFGAVSAGVTPHENLIWSIKHVEGDFHRGNNFSAVLGMGRHRFIVEVQCAREYEGKGAFPNYIANGVIEGFEEHLSRMSASSPRSIRDIYQRSPLLAGIWTWSRGGGWEGPYIKDEMWCDLNAWIMAQWALTPNATEESLFTRYATERLGLPAGQVASFRQLALLSAEAVLRWKRGTDLHLSPWWSRDQYFTFPTLPNTTAAIQSVLTSQDESVARWEQIVQLADGLTVPNAMHQETLVSSARYGLILAQMMRAVVNMTALTSSGDGWLNKYWLARYDEAKAAYVTLAARYPNTIATFYVEPALRSSNGENPSSALPRFRNAVAGLSANPTQFSQWAKAYAGPQWTNASVAGPTASLRQDGVANLIKYALRLDPAALQPFTQRLGSGEVALDIPRNPQAIDATVTLRESSDLGTWTEIARSVNGAPFTLIAPAGWSLSTSGTTTAPMANFLRSTQPTDPKLFWSIDVTTP